MSDKPLTPEERAKVLAIELYTCVDDSPQSGMEVLTKHIAAAVADARKDERERIAQLESVLRAYERWEADLILDSSAWNTSNGMPKLGEASYDELMRIQRLRNKLLGVYEQEPTQ